MDSTQYRFISLLILESSPETGERFDVRANCWESIPNMVTGREWHELIALKKCIYAIGGRGLNTVEMFEPNANKWTMMPSMLTTRGYLAATVMNCHEIDHLLN